MPSWFDKVFSAGTGKAKAKAEPAEIKMRNPILDDPEFQQEQARPRPERAKLRRIIDPVVLPDEEAPSGSVDEIRIKARPAKDGRSCTFFVDRPLTDKYSAWFTSPSAAFGNSPLAESLFEVNGVESVQITGLSIVVTRDPYAAESWRDTAIEIGARIRNHLKANAPVVTGAYLDGLPPESEIAKKLQFVIDTDVNPSIASHSGAISLERVEGNTVYIRMMGGCQGCAASAVTLKQGIYHAFRDAVPQIGAILDVTEHAAGANPYYRRMPAGMENNA